MPKLTSEKASKVEAAEDGFKPVPEGIYILQLTEDVDVREGGKGTYWRWAFEVPVSHKVDGEDVEQEHAGRKFWTNTSLSEAAYFKLKEAFKAFGVPTDTDTKELVGRRVKAAIVIKTIQSGSRKGELGNEIDRLLPLDHADATPTDATPGAVSTAKGGDDSEPLF